MPVRTYKPNYTLLLVGGQDASRAGGTNGGLHDALVVVYPLYVGVTRMRASTTMHRRGIMTMTNISRHARRLWPVALLAVLAVPHSAVPIATADSGGTPPVGAAATATVAAAGRAVTGVVQLISADAAQPGFTLALRDGSAITVALAASTKMWRLYFGPTTIADVSVGDRVSVFGTAATDGSNVFQARLVRDWSIQLAFTLLAGRIESVGGDGTASVRILWRMAKHSPFWRGELLPLVFDASSSITSGRALAQAAEAQPATASDVQAGAYVWAWGLYDSASRTLRVRQAAYHCCAGAVARGVPSPPQEIWFGRASTRDTFILRVNVSGC